MTPKDWMRGFAAAALVGMLAAGCASGPSEEDAPVAREGRLAGRLYPIADTLSLQGVIPEEFVDLARESFLPEGPLAAQTRSLDALPIDPDPGAPPKAVPVEPTLVPGEAIVRLRLPVEESLARLHRTPELADYRFEAGDWASRDLLSLRFRRGDRLPGEAETVEVADFLHATGIFGYAHPNHYRSANRVPDDEHYPLAWHYRQLDMESAWTITTGSPDIVIAVVDSGTKEHEDLTGLLPGYDFVSNPTISGDGDGRDPDPSPVGGRSASHGQHVAGTIGADSDNGIGIPGMDWKARILPVRVLGTRGRGTSLDVIAGINWATGGEVPGVPPNPTPAHILNLSLGGEALVPAEQEAIDQARARGAILVVAAGNENADARSKSLSGYQGVIVVGAVDARGQRAPYSNWGSAVDVMAPGGDLRADLNGDGHPDGVYSLWFHSGGTVDGYTFLQGTSMAAPHVAGLVGLMKALAPSLGPDQTNAILRATAKPIHQCQEGCGSGLVDPVQALLAAREQAGKEPRISLPLERLDLGPRGEATLPLTNVGDAPLAWYARFEGGLGAHLRLGRASGVIPAGATRTLEISALRSGLEPGRHEAVLEITSPDGVHEIVVSLSTEGAEPLDLGAARILALRTDAKGKTIVGGSAWTDASLGYRFSLSVPPGTWYLVATVDLDGDGLLGEGDLLGYWPGNAAPLPVEVEGDGAHEDLEFLLEPVGAH